MFRPRIRRAMFAVLAATIGILAVSAQAQTRYIECIEECARSAGDSGSVSPLYLVLGTLGLVAATVGFLRGPGTLLNLLQGRRWDDSRGENSWFTVLMLYPLVAVASIPALAVIGFIDKWFGPVGWPVWLGVLAAWWVFLVVKFTSNPTKAPQAAEDERRADSPPSGPVRASQRSTPTEDERPAIRETSRRAVHGRAPFAVDDDSMTNTAAQLDESHRDDLYILVKPVPTTPPSLEEQCLLDEMSVRGAKARAARAPAKLMGPRTTADNLELEALLARLESAPPKTPPG